MLSPTHVSRQTVFAAVLAAWSVFLPHPSRCSGLSRKTADSSSISVVADSDSGAINTGRFALVAGGTAGIITLAHLQNYNSWWKGERGPFHLGEDGGVYLHHDKLGHWYFTYLAGDIVGRSLAWSGEPKQHALLYGSGIALLFQLYVEVEDGTHPDLGFSLGDAAADVAGAAYPLLMAHKPFSFIYPKWSAIPSNAYRAGNHRSIIDDYESQYFWLSVNLHDALGDAAPRWLPDFLNIAIGTGVDGLDYRGGGHREFYLGLDVDTDTLPGDGDFLSAVKHALNYVHFPAPTVRIAPDFTWYGLRF